MRKRLNVRQHGGLVVKIVKISAITWVIEGAWVTCAKPPFLYSLEVPIKMFANSLAVLNQRTLRRTDHVHCFQT